MRPLRNSSLWHVVLFTILALPSTTASAAGPPVPFATEWSTTSFGPDGPWHAVQVHVGMPEQPIALYPGGTFRSHFLSPQICTNKTLSPGLCYATAGGLYTSASSSTAVTSAIKFPAFTDFSHGALQVIGAAGVGALDSIRIGDAVVPNVTIAIHNDVGSIYPGGATQALQVGTLGMGYLGTENQSFTGVAVPINGSLIPGYLMAQNFVSSNAFGLHIGSVRPKIPGSLYFGGYDQNRICGNITSQQGAFAGLEGEDVLRGSIDLLDVSINVIDGASPWNTSSISGLLTSANTTIGSALSVVMLPEAPYINLPKSACDAISSWLPVTYQSDLGLYTWNTDDPKYLKIVSSASALGFTFRKDQLNTQNITINVPFALLNLTLEAPLSKTPILYFPCNAQSYGRYSLGRAFLQAAFLGANWNVNNNQGIWWLAQAPGPNFASQSNAKTILDQDFTISTSENSWATSWKGAWTPLTEADITAKTSSPGPTSTFFNTVESGVVSGKVGEGDSGISGRAKAGIGAGIGICVLAAFGGALLFIERRRRQAAAAAKLDAKNLPPPLPSKNTDGQPAEMYGGPANAIQENYRNGGFGPAELHHPINPVYELTDERVKQPIYELR